MDRPPKRFAYPCRCCRDKWNAIAMYYYGDEELTPPATALLKQWKKEANRSEIETRIQIKNYLRQQFETQTRVIRNPVSCH